MYVKRLDRLSIPRGPPSYRKTPRLTGWSHRMFAAALTRLQKIGDTKREKRREVWFRVCGGTNRKPNSAMRQPSKLVKTSEVISPPKSVNRKQGSIQLGGGVPEQYDRLVGGSRLIHSRS